MISRPCPNSFAFNTQARFATSGSRGPRGGLKEWADGGLPVLVEEKLPRQQLHSALHKERHLSNRHDPTFAGFRLAIDDCLQRMAGARLRLTPVIPRVVRQHNRSGKKLRAALAALLIPEAVKGRRVRLMFQDEARFGRMVRRRRGWSPAPARPVVDNGYGREFTYVYGAVSPQAGELDTLRCAKMDTAHMGKFLAQVSAAHPAEFMRMIVAGASSHGAKALAVPENIRLYCLPPDAPERNPQEHLWDELREKEFSNRVLADMSGVQRQLDEGLPRLADDHDRIKSIGAWPWIIALNLNAN